MEFVIRVGIAVGLFWLTQEGVKVYKIKDKRSSIINY